MSETEKVINIITVGDQMTKKSIFVVLFDFHSRTMSDLQENEPLRVNVIRQLLMNGDWLDNEVEMPSDQVACLSYELVGFNTRYNVIDYSHQPLVDPSNIFQHCTGPRDTLNVLIVTIDCKKYPEDFVPHRFKEFESVMERILPNNSVVIFVRAFADQKLQRTFFKRVLGTPYQNANHFVFTDMDARDQRVFMQQTIGLNRMEFNRLIEYLNSLPPMSIESVKPKVKMYVSARRIFRKMKPVLELLCRSVCMASIGAAVSFLLVCGYRKFFNSKF